VRAAVRWPAYAPVLGDRMMFVLSVWHDGQPPLLKESRRVTPVFFHFPITEQETVTIRLPHDYRPGALPKPIAASSGDFSYALAVTHDPARNALKVERSAVNRAIEIPVAAYARARDWFQRVSVADQIGIVLTRQAEPQPK